MGIISWAYTRDRERRQAKGRALAPYILRVSRSVGRCSPLKILPGHGRCRGKFGGPALPRTHTQNSGESQSAQTREDPLIIT